jgi:hypothetical protein
VPCWDRRLSAYIGVFESACAGVFESAYIDVFESARIGALESACAGALESACAGALEWACRSARRAWAVNVDGVRLVLGCLPAACRVRILNLNLNLNWRAGAARARLPARRLPGPTLRSHPNGRATRIGRPPAARRA